MAQITHIEAFSKLFSQAFRKQFKSLFAIFCASFATLLIFDNQATDLPVGLNHGIIDGLANLSACEK